MNKIRLLIVGAGKRVSEAVLPALEIASDFIDLTRIVTRSRKSVQTAKREFDVDKLMDLDQTMIDGADLLYMAVSKPVVPDVARRLARFDLGATDLLIETPVMLFKHFWFVRILRSFRNVWVAEDCVALPYFDILNTLSNEGTWNRAVFHQAAYKYHGVAMLKRLLGSTRILSAKVRDRKGKSPCRTFAFSHDKRGIVHEPRDYSRGWFEFSGPGLTLTDRRSGADDSLRLEPVADDGLCRGFRVRDTFRPLDDAEPSLLGEVPSDASITSMMNGMKRVGFYRTLKRISIDGSGYSMEEGLDDMVIDYYLDKLGFYHPIMGVRSMAGRAFLKLVTGAAHRFA